MDKKGIEDNFLYEQYYWWFQGRRRIVRNLIKKFFKGNKQSFVLDAGCGTGIVLKDLEDIATPVGIDYSKAALNYTKQRINHIRLLCGDICNLPFKNNSFDMITILGVLYHKGVVNDDIAIKESFRVLKRGGILIIDEAAYNFLQSKHNLSVGGIRRFNRKQLINKVGKYSVKILKASYWNILMFPIFYLVVKMEGKCFSNKQYSKLTKIPNIVNCMLIKYLYTEAILLNYISIPFGPSLIIVARK